MKNLLSSSTTTLRKHSILAGIALLLTLPMALSQTDYCAQNFPSSFTTQAAPQLGSSATITQTTCVHYFTVTSSTISNIVITSTHLLFQISITTMPQRPELYPLFVMQKSTQPSIQFSSDYPSSTSTYFNIDLTDYAARTTYHYVSLPKSDYSDFLTGGGTIYIAVYLYKYSGLVDTFTYDFSIVQSSTAPCPNNCAGSKYGTCTSGLCKCGTEQIGVHCTTPATRIFFTPTAYTSQYNKDNYFYYRVTTSSYSSTSDMLSFIVNRTDSGTGGTVELYMIVQGYTKPLMPNPFRYDQTATLDSQTLVYNFTFQPSAVVTNVNDTVTVRLIGVSEESGSFHLQVVRNTVSSEGGASPSGPGAAAGLIVGCVFGGVFVIAGIIFIVALFRRSHKKKKTKRTATPIVVSNENQNSNPNPRGIRILRIENPQGAENPSNILPIQPEHVVVGSN